MADTMDDDGAPRPNLTTLRGFGPPDRQGVQATDGGPGSQPLAADGDLPADGGVSPLPRSPMADDAPTDRDPIPLAEKGASKVAQDGTMAPSGADGREPGPGESTSPHPGSKGSHDRVPLVEIEVVHEHGPAPRTEPPFPTVEVWTQHNIYVVDASLRCIEVIDRGARRKADRHPMIGHRLVGGQHREGGKMELSHPFPRPGTEAVFELGVGRYAKFSRTSTVTRVVLRLHIITVAPASVVPTWEDITSSLAAPSSSPEGENEGGT